MSLDPSVRYKYNGFSQPIICTPLSNPIQLIKLPPEFKALSVADSVEEKINHNIDIIIGNDH